MKNYRIILGSFIVSALFLSSCQDIDLLPKDNMPDELFWKTPDDFKEVNWLYTRTETFGTKDTDSDIAYELNENTTEQRYVDRPEYGCSMGLYFHRPASEQYDYREEPDVRGRSLGDRAVCG